MNVINKKNKIFLKKNVFADPILVGINCYLRLPLNNINYSDHIIIRFNCVDEIVHRGESCYLLDAYFCKSRIMLPA